MGDVLEENNLYSMLDEPTTYNLIKLIAEIFECVENTETKEPAKIDILSEEIVMVEIGPKRFRILVNDCSKFN